MTDHLAKEATPRVLIVGGGISGLATAWGLRHGSQVTLIESDQRLGGKIATTALRGHPLDLGADAFIVRNPAALELCHELGLAEALIEPSTKGAGLYARRELHPLPTGLNFGVPTDRRALWRSRTVGIFGLLSTLRDRFAISPALSRAALSELREGTKDPTIAEIFGPRLGGNVLATLIDPLVGGINAGDVQRLSLFATMPQIAEQIAGRRSLMRALRRERVEAAGVGSIFRGIDVGMMGLVTALTEALHHAGVALETGECATKIERRTEGGFRVTTTKSVYDCERLVLATPAFVSEKLLAPLSPVLAHELADIPYASVATLSMSFPASAIPPFVATDLVDLIEWRDDPATAPPEERRLPGSGVLIARSAGYLTTAASFTSTKWPRSSAPDEVVIRASVGRHGDDRIADLDDDELTQRVRKELTSILGIHDAPLEVIIQRWPDSFPQYVSGHLARVQRIERLASEIGVDLVGAAYSGIGIPSCIARAHRIAQQILTDE